MHTITVTIKQSHPAMSYLEQNMTGSRAVRNSANFLIRNVYTALGKKPYARTRNECCILVKVGMCLRLANQKKYEAYQKKLAAGKEAEYKPFSIPDTDHRMLSYGQIDAILKYSEDSAYYSCTSQVNQQAIKKTCLSWKSFFAALTAFKKDSSGFLGAPRIPGYLRTEQTTASFPSGVCRFRKEGDHTILTLANFGDLDLGSIPTEGKFVRLEAVPTGKMCRLQVTFDSEEKMPEIPESPIRMMAVDPGVSNFAACVTNTGSKPILIDGREIKSINQFFNKERARLYGELTKGRNPNDRKRRRTSKRLEAISRKRRDSLRDFFYKTAHTICRYAKEENIELILYGHNVGQKQDAVLGRINNQNFVQIPYMTFFCVLKWVASKYGIAVDLQEESYTSKADCLAGDAILVYGKDKKDTKRVFSGKRVKRGLYQSGTGVQLNADINGAANILRKRK